MYFHIVTSAFHLQQQKNAEIRGLPPNRVFRPSILPSFCQGLFLELYHWVFFNLRHDARNPYEVISGKIFVPEIWVKIFSANQIAGFFNQPYLQSRNKSRKQPHFLHVNTNLLKLKFD